MLPRDMPPPPQLDEILTPVPTPGEGFRLVSGVACAMLIQREGVDPYSIPSRRRTTLARFIRKQTFQLGIGLTYKPEAKEIFGYMLKEDQQLEELLSDLRLVLESFVDKEKQQAVPSKFDEQFQQLIVLLPQLLSIAINSAIFIYTEGIHFNLERINGFKSLLSREETHPAVVIKFDGLAYDAMLLAEGYDQLLSKIQERMGEEDSFVPQETIMQVLQVVHYLSHQEETREYV